MYLVHERKDRPGMWEVAWTWLPQFLGADPALVKQIDAELTALLHEMPQPMVSVLHAHVIMRIVDKYPMKGLLEYLSAVTQVMPEERDD
jgi:hypothetical protein